MLCYRNLHVTMTGSCNAWKCTLPTNYKLDFLGTYYLHCCKWVPSGHLLCCLEGCSLSLGVPFYFSCRFIYIDQSWKTRKRGQKRIAQNSINCDEFSWEVKEEERIVKHGIIFLLTSTLGELVQMTLLHMKSSKSFKFYLPHIKSSKSLKLYLACLF